jgi:hypothetical protein
VNEPAIGQRSTRTQRERAGGLITGASAALRGLRRLRYKRPGVEQELQ